VILSQVFDHKKKMKEIQLENREEKLSRSPGSRNGGGSGAASHAERLESRISLDRASAERVSLERWKEVERVQSARPCTFNPPPSLH
jgi:hypothetical protein